MVVYANPVAPLQRPASSCAAGRPARMPGAGGAGPAPRCDPDAGGGDGAGPAEPPGEPLELVIVGAGPHGLALTLRLLEDGFAAPALETVWGTGFRLLDGK